MSEIRVDTISEKTSANGVAVDGVTLKDGGLTTTAAVGIGTASPSKLLSLKTDGSGGAIGIDIHNSGTNSADDAIITFETQGHRNYSMGIDRSASAFVIMSEADGLGTPRITVDDDGNVGIGTNVTNSRKLVIGTGGAKTSTSTHYPMNIGQTNEASSHAGLNVYFVGGASAAVRKWQFQPVENGVANDGIIEVNPNGGRFKAVQGIQLGGDTDANKLDDYEEGTWTIPTGAVNGITYVVAGTLGVTYTKVGRNVTVFGQVGFGASTSDNNATYFGTLPFAAASNGVFVGKVQTTAGVTGACVELNGGENFLRLMKDSGGSYDYITRAESRNKTFAFTITYHV